jgi:glutamine synthetase
VLSDTFSDEGHDEIQVSPRSILKRQVARALDHGLTIKAGSEFEYYVLKETWEE